MKPKLKDFIDLSKPRDTLIIGVATGLIAIGLQNYNPLEPRACTHYCSILVGFGAIFIMILIKLLIIIVKKRKN